MQKNPKDYAVLRKNVSSKGGTTEADVKFLMKKIEDILEEVLYVLLIKQMN